MKIKGQLEKHGEMGKNKKNNMKDEKFENDNSKTKNKRKKNKKMITIKSNNKEEKTVKT